MKTLKGKIEGPHLVTEDALLEGMITDHATVASGVHFEISGMITGNLDVLPGASVVVTGMVNGLINNQGGRVVIRGMVDEVAETGPGAVTVVEGVGRVRGKWGGPLKHG